MMNDEVMLCDERSYASLRSEFMRMACASFRRAVGPLGRTFLNLGPAQVDECNLGKTLRTVVSESSPFRRLEHGRQADNSESRAQSWDRPIT
jgi:hypothetical protein